MKETSNIFQLPDSWNSSTSSNSEGDLFAEGLNNIPDGSHDHLSKYCQVSLHSTFPLTPSNPLYPPPSLANIFYFFDNSLSSSTTVKSALEPIYKRNSLPSERFMCHHGGQIATRRLGQQRSIPLRIKSIRLDGSLSFPTFDEFRVGWTLMFQSQFSMT